METRQKQKDPAKKAAEREAQRRAAGHQKARYVQKCAENKLRKTLSSPVRKEQEAAFADAHHEDSNQTLYEYVKAQKRRRGGQMKPINTVGYSYLIKRLGPWSEIMRRVNRDLELEKELARARRAEAEQAAGDAAE